MSEPTGMRPAVRDIIDTLKGDWIAALRSSGVCRMLQSRQHGGLGLSTGEFVCAVYELAALDSALGWLTATYNVTGQVAGGLVPADALVAVGHHGSGELSNGRLTGRWEPVVGAVAADWLLLPAGGDSRVLVPRDRVRVETDKHAAVLRAAGVGAVVVDDVAVGRKRIRCDEPLLSRAAAAAAVVGSADGVWRKHVEQVRARLDYSYGGDEVTDEAAAAVARAAADIDAAKLQIVAALASAAAAGAFAQSVARARDAADRILSLSRHALDASDPVTILWREVHAGCQLAAAGV